MSTAKPSARGKGKPRTIFVMDEIVQHCESMLAFKPSLHPKYSNGSGIKDRYKIDPNSLQFTIVKPEMGVCTVHFTAVIADIKHAPDAKQYAAKLRAKNKNKNDNNKANINATAQTPKLSPKATSRRSGRRFSTGNGVPLYLSMQMQNIKDLLVHINLQKHIKKQNSDNNVKPMLHLKHLNNIQQHIETIKKIKIIIIIII